MIETPVIIVTGTKRSGTSMWMQILAAAGVPLIGEAFPKNWGETIQAANPHGFYESPLRRGIFFATNPDPQTGQYLRPNATESVGVKVFIPGLCRTDLAFVRQVIGTMRHWREYAASIERLRAMESEAREPRGGNKHGPLEYMDPVLEWWLENFALIRDLVTRQYPAHLVTYEHVVDNPEEALPQILEWIGATDIEAAIAAVSPETRTQHRDRIDRGHEFEATFDELYDIVSSREPISGDFLERLNDTHRKLVPAIEAEMDRVIEDRRRRRPTANAGRDPLHPDTMESLIHDESGD